MGITSINPYGPGGKALNSTPYLQYFLQTRAHEAAQNAALDNHFNKLNESINPAGVRQQDVEGFMKRVNQNREFYNQNKKAIQNPTADNGKAYSEYMSRHQAALGYVNSSKEAAAISKQAASIFMNPATRDRLTQKTVDDYKLHDLPLDNGYQKFNPAAAEFDPKPFDINAQNQFFKSVFTPKSDLEVKATRLPDTQQLVNATIKGYKPEDKKNILGTLEQAAYSNPSIAKHVKEYFANPAVEGAAHGEVDEFYKKLTGKPIESREQLWAALQLLHKGQDEVDLKVTDDDITKSNIAFGRQVALKNMAKEDSKELIRYRKTFADAKTISPQEGIVNGGFDVGNYTYKDGGKIENGIAINAKGQPHKGKITVPIEKVNSNISAAINALDKDNSIAKNDNDLATFYTDENGRLIGVLTHRGVFKLPEQVAGSKKAAGISTKNRGIYTGTSAPTKTSTSKPFFLK